MSNTLVVDKYFASLNKQGEELCGDRVLLSEAPSSVIGVLSDGLGSGVKANILATITTKIAMTMLEGGAKIDDVVDTLGRTLPVCKVRNLAYSTFTIFQVFDSGLVYVAEFDNPTLFCYRQGRVYRINTEVRSIGELSVREGSWQGQSGDILIALSDGIVHAGIGKRLSFGWLHEHVEKYIQSLVLQELSPVKICEKVLNVVSRISDEDIGDDATILVMQLRERKTATVAVGPPVNKDDDPNYTHRLMLESQNKIVCGGTTATLVARELGVQVEVNIDNIVEDIVPPTGKINGISLVTEGMLTLSTGLKFLQKGEVPHGDNGAIKLVSNLLDCDKIHFIVGRALNSAHQNPDLPVSLSLKQQLIKDITFELEHLGKEVTVEYF